MSRPRSRAGRLAGALLVALSAAPAASAQPRPTVPAATADLRSIAEDVDRAFLAADADAVARARARATAALAARPDDAMLLHYRGYAAYREALLRDDDAQRRRRQTLLVEADRDLDRSQALRPLPETLALLGAVSAQRITGPLSMARLGYRSGRYLDQAVGAGPENPRAWLLKGVAALFTPSAFGGGAGRAEELLERAVALFASDRPALGLPAWGEAEAHAWLGRVRAQLGDRRAARAAYARALALEPDFRWVRDELLPELERAG